MVCCAFKRLPWWPASRALVTTTAAEARHDVNVGNEPDSTVEVVPYQSEWANEFEEAQDALIAAVGNVALSIEHIGSTAVPGLAAKPTIDILMVVNSLKSFLRMLPEVEAIGFEHRPDNTLVGSDDHLFVRKVTDGKRTHHLHVVKVGCAEIDQYRRFRDALRRDPTLAAEYERIKIELAAKYAADRMGYVEAKSEWLDQRLQSFPSAEL